MKLPLCYFIMISCCVSCSISVNSQTQFSGWLASFNTIKSGKKSSIHLEAQFRSTDQLQHMQAAFIRGGLNYSLKKNLVITAGYGYFHNRRTVSGITGHADEHRIWQQLLYGHAVKRIQVSHRFRLEQRFIGKSKLVNSRLENDGYAYANRLRYFIRNMLPFTKEPVFSKGMYAALQNEVFVNFGNTATVNGKFFDQNRLYLATGYRVSREWDVEIGYMNQYVSGTNKNFINNHIVQLASYLRL